MFFLQVERKGEDTGQVATIRAAYEDRFDAGKPLFWGYCVNSLVSFVVVELLMIMIINFEGNLVFLEYCFLHGTELNLNRVNVNVIDKN